MRPHARIRRIARWATIGGCITSVFVWAASTIAYCRYERPRLYIEFERGTLTFHTTISGGLNDRGWTADWMDDSADEWSENCRGYLGLTEAPQFMPLSRVWGGPGLRVFLPLWIPSIVGTLAL